jgi:Arc/MetJ-type ribon-helix-helix transcriptional regulator
MKLNTEHPPAEIVPPLLMTETVSVRLTQHERSALEQLANREERSVSNYLRKQLRSFLERKTEGTR